MESKKEFSTEKLNDFLNKIDKKLESNADIVGDENKSILKSCINELNNTKEKTITVDINKPIYEKNLNSQKENFDKIKLNTIDNINNNNDNNNIEGLTKDNFEQKLKEKIDILLNEQTSIPKKEEIISLIDKYYLTHLNIKNKIFSSEIEQLLISLLEKCPKKEDEQNIKIIENNNKNLYPFSNSIMISLSLISILKKRIITMKAIYPDFTDEFPVMIKYIESFLENFPF